MDPVLRETAKTGKEGKRMHWLTVSRGNGRQRIAWTDFSTLFFTKIGSDLN
jgi:hypothetical protein